MRPRRVTGAVMEANAIIQDVSERRLIATQINQAAAAERQRLLSDLHDNLGQVLASAVLLAAAHEREVRATAPALAASAQQLVAAMGESQRLCRDLSHELMEDSGRDLRGARTARLAHQPDRHQLLIPSLGRRCAGPVRGPVPGIVPDRAGGGDQPRSNTPVAGGLSWH